MRIGDVSRPRRFANPARLRWYAFHRSVRFALRMMKADEAPSCREVPPLHFAMPTDKIQADTPIPPSSSETGECYLQKR